MRSEQIEEHISNENDVPNESKSKDDGGVAITNSNEKRLSGSNGQPLVVEEDPAASESGRKARRLRPELFKRSYTADFDGDDGQENELLSRINQLRHQKVLYEQQ